MTLNKVGKDLIASVVIPTYDHGPTITYALKCALSQTVEDLEVLVIGDGVPGITREILAEFAERDPRVRFFDYPKGPHLGEANRGEVLQEAKGEIICYLSDDDLWLARHVETMHSMLQNADFAHSLPIRIEPDGRVESWNIDLAIPWYRTEILEARNRIPLSCGAHRLDSYRRLPLGWQTTDMPTDLFMWQQLIGEPEMHSVSGTEPTALHYPSPARKGWSLEQRVEELRQWYGRIIEPENRARFMRDAMENAVGQRAYWEAKFREAEEQIARQPQSLAELQREIDLLYDTVSLRFRDWVLGLPLFGKLALGIAGWTKRALD